MGFRMNRHGRSLVIGLSITLAAAVALSAWLASDLQRIRDELRNTQEELSHAEQLRQESDRQRQIQQKQDLDRAAMLSAEAQRERIVNQRTQQQLQTATQQRLSAVSDSLAGRRPTTALLLAAAAVHEPAALPIHQQLYDLLNRIGGVPLTAHSSAVTAAVVFDRDQRAATGDAAGNILMWDILPDGTLRPSGTLQGHEGRIETLVASDDGVLVISGSSDTNIRVWDVRSPDPSESCRVLRGHRDSVTSLSLAADARRLVSGSRDGSVRLWQLDPQNSQTVAGVLHQHSDPVLAAMITNDGQAVYAAWQDGPVKQTILSSAGDQSVQRPQLTDSSPDLSPTALACPHNGTNVAIAYSDGSIRLYQGKTSHKITGLPAPARQLEFSPDGNRLVVVSGSSGSNESEIRIWNVQQQGSAQLLQILPAIAHPLRQLAFVAGQDAMICIADDNTARYWSRREQQAYQLESELSGHDRPLSVLAVGEARPVVLTGDQTGHLRIWSLDNNSAAALPQVIAAFDDSIRQIVEHPQLDEVLVTARSGPLKRIKLDSWLSPQTSHKVFPSITPANAESADDPDQTQADKQSDPRVLHQLVTSDGLHSVRLLSDHSVQWIDLKESEVARSWQLDDVGSGIIASQISPDSRWLALAADRGRVIVIDLLAADGATHGLHSMTTSLERIRQLLFSPDGQRLAISGWGSQVSVWSQSTDTDEGAGRFVDRELLLSAESGLINSMQFSRQGDRLWTGCSDSLIREWSLERDAGQAAPVPRLMRGHSDAVDVLLVPDDQQLISGARDASIRIWDVTSDRDERPSIRLTGHQQPISALMVHNPRQDPSACWLYSASADRSIRCWFLCGGPGEQQGLVFRDNTGVVTAMKRTSDDRHLICGTQSGQLVNWPLKTDQLTELARKTAGRDLSPAELFEFNVPETWQAGDPDGGDESGFGQ